MKNQANRSEGEDLLAIYYGDVDRRIFDTDGYHSVLIGIHGLRLMRGENTPSSHGTRTTGSVKDTTYTLRTNGSRQNP